MGCLVELVECLQSAADRREAESTVYWLLFKTNLSTLVDSRPPADDAKGATLVYLSLHFHKLIELVRSVGIVTL